MVSYLREAMTAAFNVGQRRVLASHHADQDRTAEAVEQLDAALIAPASVRTAAWRRNIVDSLEMLHDAVTAEAAAHRDASSLYSDIARSQPRLRNRVRRLRVEYARLIRDIRRTVDMVTAEPDLSIAETRTVVTDLIGALRLVRGRESDLIYESYFESFDRDLEEELSGTTARGT